MFASRANEAKTSTTSPFCRAMKHYNDELKLFEMKPVSFLSQNSSDKRILLDKYYIRICSVVYPYFLARENLELSSFYPLQFQQFLTYRLFLFHNFHNNPVILLTAHHLFLPPFLIMVLLVSQADYPLYHVQPP